MVWLCPTRLIHSVFKWWFWKQMTRWWGRCKPDSRFIEWAIIFLKDSLLLFLFNWVNFSSFSWIAESKTTCFAYRFADTLNLIHWIRIIQWLIHWTHTLYKYRHIRQSIARLHTQKLKWNKCEIQIRTNNKQKKSTNKQKQFWLSQTEIAEYWVSLTWWFVWLALFWHLTSDKPIITLSDTQITW